MKLEEAPRQLPINVAFESASGAPKSFGLLRAGSREGEPGREKMIDSMVPRCDVTLDESHAPSRSQVKESFGLGDPSHLSAAPSHWKNIF